MCRLFIVHIQYLHVVECTYYRITNDLARQEVTFMSSDTVYCM